MAEHTGRKVGTEPYTNNRIWKALRADKLGYEALHQRWESLVRELMKDKNAELFIGEHKPRLAAGFTQFDSLVYNILTTWVSETGKGATIDVLCEALEACDFESLAQSLRDHFKLPKIAKPEASKVEATPGSSQDRRDVEGGRYKVVYHAKKDTPQSRRTILFSIRTFLRDWACEEQRDAVDSIIDQIGHAIGLSRQGLAGLNVSGMTQAARIGQLFRLVESQDVINPEAMKNAIDTFLNFGGSLEDVSAGIRGMLSTEKKVQEIARIEP